MAKKGHSFPSCHGFKGSTGRVQNVRGYTRAVPKARGGIVPGAGAAPIGRSGPKSLPPIPRAPVMRTQPIRRGALAAYAEGGVVKMGDSTMKTSAIGDQGNAVVKRGNPPASQADREYGGTGPLRSGYKTGGAVTKKQAAGIAQAAVKRHVAAPVPKGHKGFNKTPMFGSKTQK